MRKTIWVAGVFVVLGIIAAVLYFSFFQKKDKTAPEGTFVKIFDTKYDFEGNMKAVQSLFDSYNKLVAERSDIGSYQEDIRSLFNELYTNAPLYTKDTELANVLVNGFSTKLEATESIFNYDKNILSLKAENNIGNKNLTSETSDVRTKIEALTNTQKMTMSTLIYVVFFVGAVLVVILTLFVITSVQRSIKKFKGTLTQFQKERLW